MAESVHLTLFANEEQVEGDSTQTTLGRENTIECLAFEQHGAVPMSPSGATGRRRYQPLRIVKRIDRSTPLLLKHFAENSQMRGTFRFYRPNPDGSGDTQQHFTVEIREAAVGSVRQMVLDTSDAELSVRPELEEVTFVFDTVVFTWEAGGIMHEDSWSTQR